MMWLTRWALVWVDGGHWWQTAAPSPTPLTRPSRPRHVSELGS